MTNAPIYQSRIGDRPVGQTYLRNADTARSFGSEVGAAMQDAGRAFTSWQEAFQLRDQLAGDTRVRERREAYRSRTRETVADYGSSTGTNAVAQSEQVLDRLERIRQEEASKITNPREREKFLSDTESIAMGRADDVASKASAEEKKAATDSYQAAVTGYTEDALDHFNDDAKFEENLAMALTEQRNLAGLTGTTPEVLARADEELINETLSNRVVLMAASDPEAAMQYLEQEDRLSAVAKQKVKDMLAPAVQGDRVEKWMSQFIVSGGGSGGSFMETTMSRESGGNANAQNPNSTAGGLFQYLDSTWNQSVVAAASAGALPPEFDGMTTAELQAAKMDPGLQMAVMAYDEGRYEATLSGQGLPVNNVTKYMLHHFGMGAGAATLSAMQTNPGAAVKDVYAANGWDWDAVVAANPGVSYNMTVSELHAYAGRHIGSGGSAVEFDFAAAYSFAQTIENPADRAAFLASVEAREATEAARRRAASGAVIDEASTRYFETGESDLSLKDQITLGIDGTSAFRDMVAKNESGKLTTDMATYSLLTEMASSTNLATRKAFAAEGSIEPYVNRLSQQDYRAFTEQRALARAELEGIKMTEEQLKRNPGMAVPVTPEHRTTIGRHLDRVGVAGGAKNAEARAQAEYQMETRLRQQMIDFWQENSRQPNANEVDDMIYAQTLQIAPGGMLSDPKMMFEFDTMADGDVPTPSIEYEAIPATARVELARRLSTVLGRTPTPDEIAQAFVNSTLIKGQLAPVPLDSMEVPVEVFVYGNQLGIGEDELRQHWETYVNQVAAGLIDPNEYPFVPPTSGPVPR